MPPHKNKRILVSETSRVSDLVRFYNVNMEKYFLESQGRPIIQERGSSMRPLRTK
ncbi:hypothetical protein Golax_021502 [Gossypium laxum]|uniref:Uncharacterized protein n=1 Tax=Gossypium laxum TaxID=34288 RepID=A0A7J9ALA5_9ROSI|nr:hypothetical protein [Gossypium laxum]